MRTSTAGLGWIEARARVNCAVIGHTPPNDAIGLPACVSLRAGVDKAPHHGAPPFGFLFTLAILECTLKLLTLALLLWLAFTPGLSGRC